MMQTTSELKAKLQATKDSTRATVLRGNVTVKNTHHRSLDHRRKGAKLTASATTALASNEDQAEDDVVLEVITEQADEAIT